MFWNALGVRNGNATLNAQVLKAKPGPVSVFMCPCAACLEVESHGWSDGLTRVIMSHTNSHAVVIRAYSGRFQCS